MLSDEFILKPEEIGRANWPDLPWDVRRVTSPLGKSEYCVCATWNGQTLPVGMVYPELETHRTYLAHYQGDAARVWTKAQWNQQYGRMGKDLRECGIQHPTTWLLIHAWWQRRGVQYLHRKPGRGRNRPQWLAFFIVDTPEPYCQTWTYYRDIDWFVNRSAETLQAIYQRLGTLRPARVLEVGEPVEFPS